MKIAITGADGNMGSALRSRWSGHHDIIAIGDESDLRAPGEWSSRLAGSETIVHLAARFEETRAFDTMVDSIAMTVNVVRAAGHARRIVYSSSMWAVHGQTSLGPEGGYYVALKRACEAVVHGWSDENRRPAVSLRLGHYGSPPGTVPIEHQLLRLDDTSLLWWFDRAIAHDTPDYRVWQATGRFDGGDVG